MQLTQWAKTQTGMRGYCIRAYGEGENGQIGSNCLCPLRSMLGTLSLICFEFA